MTDQESETETVLIVEDEPRYAEGYARVLDEFDTDIATDGEEGLDRIDNSVDVVLLDRNMPGISGDEFLDRIRADGLTCPVVVVSAVEPDFDIIDMEFDAYLTKPVDHDELRDTVEDMAERKEQSPRQRFNALVEKRETLKANKPRSELEESKEYANLEEEIQELREELGIVHPLTLLKLGLFLLWWFSGIAVATAFLEPEVIGAQISAEIFLAIVLAHLCSVLLIISLLPGPSDSMDLRAETGQGGSEDLS